MFQKIRSLNYRALFKTLSDVRIIGMLVFGVLVLLISWSGIKAIQTNYDLQKKIAKLQQETAVGDLENTNLKLRNEYYKTDQFLELAARRQFGKAAPGEKLLLVPKNVALAHTVELPQAKKPGKNAAPPKSRAQQNRQAWLAFFLHRQN